MQITSKGQVTIPKEIRERFGLLPHTDVEFVVVGEVIQLRKADSNRRRGEAIVAHLRGRGNVAMSTEEILRLTRGDDASPHR